MIIPVPDDARTQIEIALGMGALWIAASLVFSRLLTRKPFDRQAKWVRPARDHTDYRGRPF